MKWIYYIVFFLSLGSILCGVLFIKEGVAKESVIPKKRYPKYEIHLDHPEVKNKGLQKILTDYLEKEKANFMKELEEIKNPTATYTLNIYEKNFTYKNYISYVFKKEEYLGGAHPNTFLWTVVYDIKKEKEITLEDMIREDPNFLSMVSNSIRSDLLFSPSIVNTPHLYAGTSPKKENFKHFVFVESGIIFYFPPYQVAPYSSGIIESFVEYPV